jgi:insulysin
MLNFLMLDCLFSYAKLYKIFLAPFMLNYLYSYTNINKSTLDTNQYKYIVLKNGLKLLLISDKSTDKSGCSLCVNIGSFDEPESVSGLSHFLEHLLFMGTSKYPDENEYMEYLSIHNGSSNAYTTDDSTVYYFDISNKYFEEGLDRFVNFFISPLFKSSSVDREISAVNSEFLCNVSNDTSRRYRLLQICARDHLEESRFTIGNTRSLRIEDIRERVIDLYRRSYISSRMVGVIYSNKDMEELEELITVFEDINKDMSHNDTTQVDMTHMTYPVYKCKYYNEYIKKVVLSNYIPITTQYKTDENIFKEEVKNKLIKLKSLEDTRRLDIYIKTIHSLVNTNVYQVLMDNFLKEDKGCIRILKDKRLSYDIKINIDNQKYYGIFNISVYLTSKGFSNTDLVLDCIEEYLVSSGIEEEDLRRAVDLNKINFMYRDKEDVIDIIDEMSESLFKVPVKNILDYEYSEVLPSKELVEEVMKNIIDRKEWIIILSSNEFNYIKKDGDLLNLKDDRLLSMKDNIFEIEYEIPN